jgi:hypothetical protein
MDTLKQSILCFGFAILTSLLICWLFQHVYKNHPCQRERAENIAKQQSPITREMFSAFLELAKKSPIDLLKTVVADWFTLIGITGLRCSEYAQKTQSEVEKYKYPLGKCVVKAFTLNDWKFYNSKGRVINNTLKS